MGLLAAALFILQPAFAQPPLRLERSIALTAVEGRIDHLAADVAGKRLFVAALGNNTLEVVDLTGGVKLHSVSGLSEPQGVAYVAETGRVYVANGQSGKLDSFDSKTFEPAGSIAIGEDADNVRYDTASRELWVGYGSGALVPVSAGAARKRAEIRLDQHPESFQLEKNGPRIFVNVPKAGRIAVIDRNKHAVAATWPVTGAAQNYPMALDEAGGRLFTGCRKPARVLVFDMHTGKQVTAFECVADTDDLFFDAARKRVYVIGGGGFVDVFAQQTPDRYERLARVATASGARTGLFIPELGRLCVAVPHRGTQAASIRVYTVE